jgi:DNA-directed RNA polymerase subunit RPC12/RpoP
MKKFSERVCDYCGAIYEPIRIDQRFHSPECHYQYFVEERKRALASWRAQQRTASFFASSVQPMDEETDEDNRVRRPVQNDMGHRCWLKKQEV